ncbi:MAG: GNAT family N-acetyltransferase [Syntrophales bacterium]|nr:GNAT family N-acetyltransferase [Syntrophales bacterium]
MALDTKQQHLIDHNYLLSMGLLMSNSVLGEFHDSYDIGIINSGVRNRLFNIVFIKRRAAKPEAVIRRWERFFESRGLPFRVSITPGFEDGYVSLLEERGYKQIEPETVMVLSDLPERAGWQAGLIVKKVVKPDELAHFQETAAKGFSLPEGSGPFVITEQVRDLPDADLFIGYADGLPASTSMLIKTGHVAGIYWVATLKEYRGRGFGEAMTRHAVLAGMGKGCTFASLQATAMGRPVYERIGFSNPYNYRVYAPSEKL